MLEHIYGAPLSSLEHIPLTLVQELIPSAHKYELNELKDYLGHLLLERAKPQNVLVSYNIAKQYRLEGPRKELEEFMKERNNEVLEHLVENAEYPELASETN